MRHIPHNANLLHQAELKAAGFNTLIAVTLTKWVGTMICAYVFSLLAIAGFPFGSTSIPQYVQWVSQTFIQLTMLSVIMVGQAILSRNQELQADEQFKFVKQIYDDIEHIKSQLAELHNEPTATLQPDH